MLADYIVDAPRYRNGIFWIASTIEINAVRRDGNVFELEAVFLAVGLGSEWWLLCIGRTILCCALNRLFLGEFHLSCCYQLINMLE